MDVVVLDSVLLGVSLLVFAFVSVALACTDDREHVLHSQAVTFRFKRASFRGLKLPVYFRGVRVRGSEGSRSGAMLLFDSFIYKNRDWAVIILIVSLIFSFAMAAVLISHLVLFDLVSVPFLYKQ